MADNSSPTSTNSSLQSWKRFGLNPSDTGKILVYTYRHGVETSSQEELCEKLERDPTLRCAKLPIPPGRRRIEVLQEDLYPPDRQAEFAALPNAKNSLASIMLPTLVYYSRMLRGKYRDLYIVSRESTPDGSSVGSTTVGVEGSQELGDSGVLGGSGVS